MRGLLLCCLVALAACQNLRYDLTLNPKKTYEYKYVGRVDFGLDKPNLAESGVEITCKATISGVSEQTFLLQVSDLAFAEYNGFREKNGYDASPKLTQRIAALLAKPFVFDYTNGHIGDIRTSAEIPTSIVNIVRGILSFFQVTVKTTQNVYELVEFGIHGKCQSNYGIEENEETKDWTITRVVDVTNCKEKAEMYKGMAVAVEDDLSKQRGKSVISTMRYVYNVKPSAEGGLINRAHGLEQQHFSAFNVKRGTFRMQAVKELELLRVTDAAKTSTYGPMESKGNIVYKFDPNVNINIPLIMENLDNPVPKVIELIKHLAEANIYSIDNATSENVIKAYQLIRVMSYEGLDTIWKQVAPNLDHRRWFLNFISESCDAKVLEFLKDRYKAQDLSPTEAWQTLLLVTEHLEATPELVEAAKDFLRMPYCKSHTLVWHTTALSYGSLVYKHCAHYTPCPVTAVQPLLDMANEAVRSGNKEDMVLALKALGNAGHPGSIKTIMRFLPGVAATPIDLPTHVQSAAVQAMRLIATRDPHSVQDVTMSVFIQKKIPAEIRMHAFRILFETKPSMALVSTVTAHLMEEKDLQVASFAYSYLEGFARSRTPDNHFLSIASSVAVRILAPKFGRLSYYDSKAKHIDWFDHDYLAGTASEFFMLRNGTNMLPTNIMMTSKFHFIGKIFQIMEFGFQPDGIKELFGSGIPEFKGDFSMSDIHAVFNVLKNWESMRNDKPVLSAYTRFMGQEWFFGDITKETIRNIMMAFSPAAGKSSPLWTAIENLQKGSSWHYTRSFLTIEARYFQATTLGFPIEISKYYNSLTGVKVNGKATINPPLTDSIGQLLTSDITLETDGYVGVTKDFWVFYGINTELFQSGSELKIKLPISVPWKFTSKINIPEKNFQLDFSPWKEEFELFSLRSDVYAVSRNIEDPASPKRTPMIPRSMSAQRDHSEMLTQNTWHPASMMCTEYNTYGIGICAEYELKREYYNEEYPLSYFLGYTNIAVRVNPVQTAKTVENIHFEFAAGPSRHPMSARQLLQTLRRLSKEATQRINLASDSASGSRRSHQGHHDVLLDAWDSTPQALFNFKAFAMSGSHKPEGYNTAMYYTPAANTQNAQLIVSQVGANSSWKMCIDTAVDAEARAHVRWGAECQSYEMSMKAAATIANASKPEVKAKVHWTKVPKYMAEFGKTVEWYIPGMAYLYGFSQEAAKNPEHEVSASVTSAGPATLGVKIRFPQYTVYNKAMPVPMLSEHQPQNMTNTTTGWI